MSSVRVQSIDALRGLRLALGRFADRTGNILNDADAELQRTLNWLDTEQESYWKSQIHHRTDEVAQAKQAVLVKKLCRHVDGSPGSAVEEEKAMHQATRRLEQAKQKLTGVRQYARLLQKEILNYRGQVQRLAQDLAVDVPLASERLEKLVGRLEQYVALQPEAAAASPAGEDMETPSPEETTASMARPEPAVEIEPRRNAPAGQTGAPAAQGDTDADAPASVDAPEKN